MYIPFPVEIPGCHRRVKGAKGRHKNLNMFHKNGYIYEYLCIQLLHFIKYQTIHRRSE